MIKLTDSSKSSRSSALLAGSCRSWSHLHSRLQLRNPHQLHWRRPSPKDSRIHPRHRCQVRRPTSATPSVPQKLMTALRVKFVQRNARRDLMVIAQRQQASSVESQEPTSVMQRQPRRRAQRAFQILLQLSDPILAFLVRPGSQSGRYLALSKRIF